MNIHRKMKVTKLIGCVLLFGMMMCACQREKETPGEMVQSSVQTALQSESIDAKESQPIAEDQNSDESYVAETWENYPWQLRPGEVAMENFLVTAFSPIGKTMYIWGGGWNEEDTGAGVDATTLGLSPLWEEFASKQTAEYDYHDYKYEIHNGLDCSGYVGWLIYNLFETENGREGYVMKSSEMAENFADRGWGTYTPADKVSNWQLGDIMSMNGHVWISLGSCEDGSVLALHSSVTGVSVCGISLPDVEESQAVKLAKEFMSTYYPEWYERFPDCSRPYRYLTESGQFRWREEVLGDKWSLKTLKPEEMLHSLGEKSLAK